MRAGSANGGVGRAGGGADAAAGPAAAVGRQKQAQSNSSGSAASSSSGRGEATEKGGGGSNKQARRRSKRREDVVRAIRDRLPAAPSCWGNVSVVRERRGRRERPGDVCRGGGAGNAVEVEEEGAGSAALPAWCCLCPDGGDCSLEPNPSANGKEDPGLRSLLERNDFYSDDCNPHAAAAVHDAATPAADFD